MRALLLLSFCWTGVVAMDIQGSIVIKHKLTKRKVTTAASGYSRGAVVPLETDASGDPLSFERRHVVVYLAESIPSAPTTVTLEQKNRQFSPDLVVISAGSTVSFPNLDPIFHNVFSLSKPKSFDLGNYSKGQTRLVTFDKPGVVMVNCRLHTNMSATIVVTPNAYFTRPDENGHFVLRGVPAGRHTVIAWHKAAGFFRQPVDTREGSAPPIEFVIPLAENGTLISANVK
jgi:plastocyanin